MRPSILSSLLSCALSLVVISAAFADDKLPVFVSIAPQKYFVQQIGKELVNVRVMVQPGADPHSYEPRPRQMVAFSRAQLYFAIGIEFETAKLKKIIATHPQIKVVRTDRGIPKIPMAATHHKEEEFHETDEPGHGGLDPHIWLSPPLVMVQARTILRALQDIDPTRRSVYEANYNAFISELVKLDTDLKHIFAGRHGLRFMVFHPSWGYFAHSYGLQQVAIELEGKAPKPAQLKELIQHARENDIKIIFVQPQFSAKSANLIAKEIGGEVAFVDPLAEDWSANLREVAKKFKSALK
jgi:zinc transport system substrate-binding protein